jgi:hypothetical protein
MAVGNARNAVANENTGGVSHFTNSPRLWLEKHAQDEDFAYRWCARARAHTQSRTHARTHVLAHTKHGD